MHQINTHKSTILSKLQILKKKFALAHQSNKNSERLLEINKNIFTIQEIMNKLEHDSLTWQDLETIGITRTHILTYTTTMENNIPVEFNDFTLLSEIPIKNIISNNMHHIDLDFINILYSILEYINDNYQTIFTQKILISASKSNYLREHFYTQYQDILHVFHSNMDFLTISTNSNQHEQLIQKEYVQLIKNIYSFFVNIQNYIDIITNDPNFSNEDFLQTITSTDKDISIYGLPLSIALDECNVFISEALQYLNIKNKDLFDHLFLDKKL